jgi:hypothetical protein
LLAEHLLAVEVEALRLAEMMARKPPSSGTGSVREDKDMETGRASIEVQLIIVVGAFFALMVVVAAIDFWYATFDDDRRRPPR